MTQSLIFLHSKPQPDSDNVYQEELYHTQTMTSYWWSGHGKLSEPFKGLTSPFLGYLGRRGAILKTNAIFCFSTLHYNMLHFRSVLYSVRREREGQKGSGRPTGRPMAFLERKSNYYFFFFKRPLAYQLAYHRSATHIPTHFPTRACTVHEDSFAAWGEVWRMYLGRTRSLERKMVTRLGCDEWTRHNA